MSRTACICGRSRQRQTVALTTLPVGSLYARQGMYVSVSSGCRRGGQVVVFLVWGRVGRCGQELRWPRSSRGDGRLGQNEGIPLLFRLPTGKPRSTIFSNPGATACSIRQNKTATRPGRQEKKSGHSYVTLCMAGDGRETRDGKEAKRERYLPAKKTTRLKGTYTLSAKCGCHEAAR